ncbi:MAG: phytoene desaturase family protein [Cyclobacteriaceae bacterium]
MDVTVVGSGMGALSAGVLLSQQGLKVRMIDQNYIPGGCTGSYWRKGFVFEAGATTIVGLDKYMPLAWLLDKTGIKLPLKRLPVPMQVHLSTSKTLTRHQHLETWIEEASRVFGEKGQAKFWRFCYEISQFVWEASTRYTNFPPANFKDLIQLAAKAKPSNLSKIHLAFKSMDWLLKKFGLYENTAFRNFVNEQLLITAQNHAEEVNVLFGATAICYTNYNNYYADGGLSSIVNPMVEYMESKGGVLISRKKIVKVVRQKNLYEFETDKGEKYQSEYFISGIPVNNTAEIYEAGIARKKTILPSNKLYSAFQMGIGFKTSNKPHVLHHQIHLDAPMPYTGSHSIFLSLSHPEDSARCEPGHAVASISTHIKDPGVFAHYDADVLENFIIEKLEQLGFLEKEAIVYQHSSGPKAWQKWTGRAMGFVGGYPQYLSIKPWQMNEARLDKHKAYQVGDTVYPGQGIPGAVLSGIIASQKLASDWLK